MCQKPRQNNLKFSVIQWKMYISEVQSIQDTVAANQKQKKRKKKENKIGLRKKRTKQVGLFVMLWVIWP